MTWGTALVLAIVILIVGAIIFKLVRDKKNGKSSCGCDCSSCNACCPGCQPQNVTKDTEK